MSLASRRSISHQSTVRLGAIPKFRAGWYLEASIRLSKHALNRTLTSGFISYGRSLADVKSDPVAVSSGLYLLMRKSISSRALHTISNENPARYALQHISLGHTSLAGCGRQYRRLRSSNSSAGSNSPKFRRYCLRYVFDLNLTFSLRHMPSSASECPWYEPASESFLSPVSRLVPQFPSHRFP